MTTDHDLFKSQSNFDEADVLEAPTSDDIYAKSFELATADETEIEIDVAPANLVAGVTDDELKAVLARAKRVDELEERLTKTHDTAFGRMGNLEQQFRQLQQERSQHVAAPTLTPDSFKALNEYFGDSDIGTALANDLAQLQLGSSQNIPSGIDEQRYNSDISQIKNDFEEKLVSIVHPDWREIKGSQEFSNWYHSLDTRSQEVISSSYKSEDVTHALNEFKIWHGKLLASVDKKQNRLENALPLASGGGRHSKQANPSYEDAFNQGYQNARK